ncbi:MAG: glycosyltransferase family 2 protein [Lacipirellulaceae bacterium]
MRANSALEPAVDAGSPRVSVCICTMSRPDDLRLALESLAACVPMSHEVVVSDDSPEHDRRSELVCDEFPRVIYRRGPRRGLAANRNSIVALSSGDWVHFIDDDVVVPCDLYGRVTRVLVGCRDSSVVTGVERRVLRGAAAKVTILGPPRIGFWAHATEARGKPNCVVINAAFFPRRLFQSGVMFDEFLRYGCEEFDVSLAAARAGFPLHFDPSIEVTHTPSTDNRDWYADVVLASTVYAGLKRHWVHRRSPLAAIVFLAIAVPRVVVHRLRTEGVASIAPLVVQIARGVGAFVRRNVFGARRFASGWSDLRV